MTLPAPHTLPGERGLAVAEAPSVPGMRPSGVQELPEAVLGGVGRVARVEPSAYDPVRDIETGVLNPDGIARASAPSAPPPSYPDPGRRSGE
ncbi:hypothetical protein [Streptomyces sp. NBC_00691]|uniref:hypothetical protein n=1 Tax=Streptomyces sp. NBC_00691 TaxID=2903671 RepID=UPI002E374164|nr:hypothetical protein [Streptomyces sp. NBC_00691]